MKNLLTNYRLTFYLSILVIFAACDNYVQFKEPVPSSSENLYEIPANYHGIYVNEKPDTERIQICAEGIFKISLLSFTQPIDFYKHSPECKAEIAEFYKPESNDCVQMDFTGYPDSIKTKLFELDTIFGFGNNYALLPFENNLLLNYIHNGYSSLKVMKQEKDNSITIYAVEVEDMINHDGPISKSMGLIRKSNGVYQFVMKPSKEELKNILKYGYQRKESVLKPLITYN